MAKVYMLCGLPGSGKSFFSREFEKKTGAIRFCLDEEMLAKYSYKYDDEQYGYLSKREKERIWNNAQEYLIKNIDVILDWSFWCGSQRRIWKERFDREGYEHELIYFDTPMEVIRDRLAVRNQSDLGGCHKIPFDEVVRFSAYFEAPSENENLNIRRIAYKL